MLRWLKRYKWWLIISGIILLMIGLIIGGIHLEEQRQAEFKQEMIKQVREHVSTIEDSIRSYDKYNRINKITIDYDSVKHNPMGGINVRAYINDDKTLSCENNLNLTSEDGADKYNVGGGMSNKLDDFFK
ncbi:DUF1310 family protein [Bombilactobacillus thymidiniphilus]|uniref:DUF1310 domain-containing protein n=1 Tax=Bombilactobacillus thymidiniphilus TaxID=2923363 RepID=A0ABY4PET8_9LACO|nr:DUF1310 family protein [Bombilactobacillus thymidiniphilus]UQS84266.1 DUF1310 domain-containing protein [Bombilactobacillus thymidiniphilus]